MNRRGVQRLALVTAAVAIAATGCAPSDKAINAFRAGDGSITAAQGAQPGAAPGQLSGQRASTGTGPGGATGVLAAVGGSGSTVRSGTSETTTGSVSSGTTSGAVSTGGTTGSGTTGSGTSGAGTTGAGTTTGVTDALIKIGFHGALTINGAVSTDAVLHTKSLTQAYWDAVNSHGGINGRKVNVTFLDDQYDPSIATTQCNTLIKQGMFFIGSTGGADQVVACGQTVPKQHVPYLSVGVSEKGLVGNPYYFPLTITYDQQAPLIAELMIHKYHAKPSEIAMFHAAGANFNGPNAKFVEAVKRLGGAAPKIDDAVDKTGNPNELQGECIKMQQNGIKFATFLTSPTVTTQFVSVCPNSGAQLFGWANTDPCDSNPNALGSPGMAGCVSVSAFHHADSAAGAKSPLTKFCHDAWAAEQSDSFPPEQEIICGLFDIMRQGLVATGRELTRERFVDTLRHLKYDDGLMSPVNFNGGPYSTTTSCLWQALDHSPWHQEIDSAWRSSY